MQPLVTSQTLSPWEPGLTALFLYGLMILVLIALLLFLAVWLGEKKISPEKKRAYECGIIPSGPVRLAFPLPFYLVAVFFLIFDVEALFIFAWAIAAFDLGWPGWLQIVFFIILLLAGLIYIWKKKGLSWVEHFEKI
ncbi:MAG: NADH-quinone oxidoreductase subunit A [Deltaproteobacteria bacterium]|nr:NADH-quinone oxidoreductase subunit A [Deltaproteobacteria bacterium]